MPKESELRREVLQLLRPVHGVAIESPIEPGTPDVNCALGWIELKSLLAWPVHATTVVQPPHFEPAQRLWLKKRCSSGGKAWLLLRVGCEWCLVWGWHAGEYLGVIWDRSDLVVRTPTGPVAYWPERPDSSDLIKALMLRNWLSG